MPNSWPEGEKSALIWTQPSPSPPRSHCLFRIRLPFQLSFKSKDGRELIRYNNLTPPDGNPDFKPARRPIPDPKIPTSAEQAYVEVWPSIRKSKERDARASYEEALKRDPGSVPAHIALGLSYYRSGEYDKAANPSHAGALRRNPGRRRCATTTSRSFCAPKEKTAKPSII